MNEQKNYLLELHEKKYKEKIDALFKEREEALGIRVVEKKFDERKDLHVLCKRDFDESFIVWTSFYTGEEKTSYRSFYNGTYDMSLKEGINELERRSEKKLIKQKQASKYVEIER